MNTLERNHFLVKSVDLHFQFIPFERSLVNAIEEKPFCFEVCKTAFLGVLVLKDIFEQNQLNPIICQIITELGNICFI